MKKPLSNMTDQEFREAMAALGLNNKGIAKALSVSPATTSAYANDRQAIPTSIAQDVNDLLRARATYVQRLAGSAAAASVGTMIQFSNEEKRRAPDTRPPPLWHRKPQDNAARSVTWPAYRVYRDHTDPARDGLLIFGLALRNWRERVKAVLHQHPGTALWSNEAVTLDRVISILKDVRATGGPYDFALTEGEFMTVSSALRWLATGEMHISWPVEMRQDQAKRSAFALYRHWFNHKTRGYAPKQKKRLVRLDNSATFPCGCTREHGQIVRRCKLHTPPG